MSRDYSQISPKFWIGKTGKQIRGLGHEAQVVAFYVLTNQHANMLGLYYLPVPYISHDTGLSIEGAKKALQDLVDTGFCNYDEAAEVVWICEMARFQVGENLEPADNRCKHIQKEYLNVPDNNMLPLFFDRYATHFHIPVVRGAAASSSKPIRSPIEAPPKSLGSQDQEQEQEQNQEKIPAASAATPYLPARKNRKKTDMPIGFGISERVRHWAREKGFEPYLEAHFEKFLSSVAAHAYKYADWDEPFISCIREDWGSVRSKLEAKVGFRLSSSKLTCEFRGDPHNPQQDVCGAAGAKKVAFYGNRALCENHRAAVSDVPKREMPEEARQLLDNFLARNVTSRRSTI